MESKLETITKKALAKVPQTIEVLIIDNTTNKAEYIELLRNANIPVEVLPPRFIRTGGVQVGQYKIIFINYDTIKPDQGEFLEGIRRQNPDAGIYLYCQEPEHTVPIRTPKSTEIDPKLKVRLIVDIEYFRRQLVGIVNQYVLPTD